MERQIHRTFLSRSLLFYFLLLLSATTHAGIIVNPPTPYPQKEIGATGIALYFAAQNTAFAVSELITPKGFRGINTASPNLPANYIWIDVKSDATFTIDGTKTLVATLSLSTSSGSEVPLKGASGYSDNSSVPATCASCQGTGGVSSARYTQGSVYRLVFSLDSLVGLPGATITAADLSTNLASGSSAIVTQTMYLTIGIAADSAVNGPLTASSVEATKAESISFTLSLTNKFPTMSSGGAIPNCSNLADPNFYFPGDSEIILLPDQYGMSTNGGAPLQFTMLNANRGANYIGLDNTGNYVNNSIVAFADYGGSAPRVGSFQNAESESDTANNYSAAVYAINQAGLVSQTCLSNSTVKARSIEGILKKSKCYIATSAYQDGDASPVMLLRRFRDQVLQKSASGRAFIDWYYQVSPSLAEWAWDKPWFRMLALKWLTPVQILAWLSTDAIAAESSGQPYIDKIKQQLNEADAKNADVKSPQAFSSGSQTPFIDSVRGKLKPNSHEGESYIERVRREQLKDAATQSESKGYIEQEREKLDPVSDPGSVIARVKAGTYKREPLHKPNISNAAGFRIGVIPKVSVSSGGQSFSFEDVYGSEWKPDVTFHYERQIFHSEDFGSFAPSVDFGLSYAGAKGRLAFPFNGSSQSRTNFSLIQVPVILGGVYRFNLFRILRPYVAAGAGPVFLAEIRNDEQKGKRDYSLVYSAAGGVSLLLDFLEPRALREGYDSAGFQHVFIFAEYMTMDTISGDVRVARNGLYSGFLFEF